MAKSTLFPLLMAAGGLTAVGLMAAAASPAVRREATEALQTSAHWWQSIVDRVSRHEGRYDSVNRNTDGAGLSFGRFQWAQRPGTLGALLAAMEAADPARFRAAFGPHVRDLLTVATKGLMVPVDGAQLWDEPWVSRFVAAGRDPVFQAVQDRLATEGPHFQAAMKAARLLGVVTERGVALMLDTAVQQGPGFATELAAKVRGLYAGHTIPMKTVLDTFARMAPAHFLRTSAPTGPYPKEHLRWEQVGPSAWHVFAGRLDLYEDILRRRLGIVTDPHLSDAPLTGAGV